MSDLAFLFYASIANVPAMTCFLLGFLLATALHTVLSGETVPYPSPDEQAKPERLEPSQAGDDDQDLAPGYGYLFPQG